MPKEPYKRDYILQKRPIILRSPLIVLTPYEECVENVSRICAEDVEDMCGRCGEYEENVSRMCQECVEIALRMCEDCVENV